jgi:hypothetical protein
LEITDSENVSELMRWFPTLGLGYRGETPGGWGALGKIEFFTRDSLYATVHFDHEMKTWSEGNGDWKLAPGFGSYLSSVIDSQGEKHSVGDHGPERDQVRP